MKTPLRLLALALAVCLPLRLVGADDLKSLTGTWKPVQAELGGQPMPPAILKAITLKIDGANYEVVVETERGPAIDQGTVKIDAATTPKSMTIAGVSGPNQGKTFPAIYEFKDDTLRVCYDLGGEKRPAEFKTTPGTKLYLVTYQRVK